MNNNLAQILNVMSEKDQKMRRRARKTGIWNDQLDKINTRKLKGIIKKYGWPISSLVGKKASRNAWLITQHADHDVKFQKRILNLLEKIYNQNPLEIDRRHIAFLRDRVLVNEGKHQVFGTQFHTNSNGVFGLRPIKNIKKIDTLRKDYGLPPLRVYLDLTPQPLSPNRKVRKG